MSLSFIVVVVVVVVVAAAVVVAVVVVKHAIGENILSKALMSKKGNSNF